MLTACNPDVPVGGGTQTTASTAGIAEHKIRPEERHLFELEARYPGFGGYGVDSLGRPKVWLASSDYAAAARADIEHLHALPSEISSRRLSFAASEVGVAEYTFTELARVRDIISDELMSVETGILEVAVDGGRNRVDVGALSPQLPAARRLIGERLRTAGLPEGAVAIRVTTPAQLDIGRAPVSMLRTSVNTSLTEPNIPAVGGVRQVNSLALPCTIGLIVERSGVPGSVSNSHCTPTLFGLDAGYQIYNGNSYQLLAREAVDPPSFSSAICGSVPCRDSDAAFFVAEDTVALRRGAIARPTAYATGWGNAGPLSVDTTLRFFTITSVAQPSTLAQGHYVMKVGQSTGWTEGIVLHPCRDVLFPAAGYKVRCAIHAKYYGGGGDSGGPVFLSTSGNHVMLAGLHTGSNSGTQETYVSNWHRVVSDLGGSINAITDITVSPPTLGGSVEGGLPSLSWTGAITTNAILPTTYRIYRWTYDTSAGWTEWQELIGTVQALDFIDYDRFVDVYYGSTVPPSGTSFVRYHITAENHGVIAGSANVYFRSFGGL